MPNTTLEALFYKNLVNLICQQKVIKIIVIIIKIFSASFLFNNFSKLIMI